MDKKEELERLKQQLKKLDYDLTVYTNKYVIQGLWIQRFHLQGQIIKATMEASKED